MQYSLISCTQIISHVFSLMGRRSEEGQTAQTGSGELKELGWHGARGPTRPQLCPCQRLNGPGNWSR